MVILRATIGNIRFNAATGAFEARVRTEAADGIEEITARAYLPRSASPEAVKAALLAVARARGEGRTPQS